MKPRSWLRVGHVVRINGLTGRPELNDHRGIVVDPLSSSNGRWAVHVLATGERVALLPERLSLDCPPPSAPLPSESDLRALDLVKLTTILADDGPRSMDACSMVCSELFRRANSAGRGSRGKQIRATLARLPIGGGWLDASMANVEAAKFAAQPAPELETLYRAGFDDCHRFLRIECPGIAIAPYGSEPAIRGS